jgi:hypothetical protein
VKIAATANKLVFQTRLTGKALVLSALPIVCSLLLFYFSLDAFKKFAPTDPARIPFAGIPMLVAVVIAATVIITLRHFLGRQVTVEEDYLVYSDANTELHLEIARMAYSPPNEGFLKAIMFSDGETFVHLPAIFLGDRPFVELNEAITKKRRKARNKRDTYSL